MLSDTHCHLEMLGDDPEIGKLITNAREEGLSLIVTIGTDPDSSRRASALSKVYPDVWATVGIHPHESGMATPEAMETFRQLIRENPRIRGIGETGLDYHYDHAPRETQKSSFVRHIALAREVRLPLVVHSRNAAPDTLELLKKEGASEVGGILHCFSENWEMAEALLGLNFMISFSGIITFKNAAALREVVSRVPLDRILIETDAPYLAPAPYRGKRNEPGFVKKVAEKISEIRNLPLSEVISATTRNAREIYRVTAP
jgi:TatD DNase family protein